MDAMVVAEVVEGSPFAPPLGAVRERDAVTVGPEVQPAALVPQKITPSRTLADLLQGFMEESNIRWIEILGGIAIVGCAIGLVFSLRATLAYIPYFPALLFLIFTVSFHGAGLYTLRRWKLAAVSRVILIIALLLVPLSFSAAVALSAQGEAQREWNDPLFLVAMFVGFSVFGWVAYSGSRELTGEGALRLTAAILGGCLAQVVINRTAMPGLQRTGIVGLALLPVAAYLIAALGQIFRAQAWRRMTARRIEQTFLILGVSAFALLPAIALLVVKVKPHWGTFVQLAPLLSLVATSVLAIGLVVHLRALAKGLAPLRTAGTAVALIGGALSIFLGVIVWPRPDLMLSLSLLCGVLLLAIAVKTRLPALHGAAVAALALAVLIGFIWFQGLVRLDTALGVHWVQALLRGRTSLLLTALAAVIGGAGAWMWTKREARIGSAYLIAAGVFGVLSLLVAGWSGFVPIAEPWKGDGDLTGPLFLCYGVALLVIAIVVTSEYVLAAGMALLWVALIQLLDMNVTMQQWLTGMHLMPERPVLVATIMEGVILAVIALVLSKPNWDLLRELFWQAPEKAERRNPLIVPLTYGAAVAIVAATPFILWVLPGRFGVHALYASLVALVWGIVCVARRWPEALAALQAMGAVAAAFAIAAIWSPATADQLWFLRGGHLQAQLLALAATAGVWSLVRRFAREGTVLHTLLHPEFPACDHVLLGLGVALLTMLAASSALPGFGWELGFGVAELNVQDLPWLDQEHRWRLAWGVAAIAGALVIALVDRITGWKLIGLTLVGWAGLFLVAQLWQGELASAAAARWLFVGYGAVLMGLFVLGDHAHRGLQSLAWLRWQSHEGTRRANAATLADGLGQDRLKPELQLGRLKPELQREWFRFQPLVLGVLPMLVLTIIAVAQHASGVLLRGPVEGTFFERIGPTVSYAGPLLVGVTIFLGLALAQRQSAFALGGGLLFQLAANLAFILHITGQKPVAEALRWAEGLQWNTIAAAAYSLLWYSLAQFLLPRETQNLPGRLQRDRFYVGQLTLASGLLIAVAIWAAGGAIWQPDALPAEMQFLGHSSNLLAAGIMWLPLLAAVGVSRERQTWVIASSVIVLMFVAAMPIAALWLEVMRGAGTWTAFHVLEVGWLAIAAVVAVVYTWQERRTTSAVVNPEQRTNEGYAPHHALAACLCGAVVFLALRGNLLDPDQPYYSAGATAGVCLVLILLGTARRSQPYAWASLVAAPLAAALPWFTFSFGPLWTVLGKFGICGDGAR